MLQLIKILQLQKSFTIFLEFFILISLLNSCNNGIDKNVERVLIEKVKPLIDSSKKQDQNWHYDSSIIYITRAIELIKGKKSQVIDSTLAILYNIRGDDYRKMSEFKKAWDDYQASLNITENKPEFKHIRFKSNYGLAALFYYYKQNDNTEALKYINEAALNALNKHDSIMVLYFICESYLQQRNKDSAQKYLENMTELIPYSIDSSKFINSGSSQYLKMVPWIWESKAKIGALNKIFSYTVLSDINTSIELNQGVKDTALIREEYQLCAVFYTKAEYLLLHSMYRDIAFNCLDSSNTIARDIKFTDIDMKSSKLLHEFYINRGDTGLTSKYKHRGDSLFRLQNNEQVKLAKQRLEESEELKEKYKLQKNTAIIAGAIIIAFLIIIVFIFYRKKRKLRYKYDIAMNKLEGRNDWNAIYEEFIVQKENVLKLDGNYDFTKIISLLGKHFKCKFGGIGIFDNKEIKLVYENHSVSQKIITAFQLITKKDFIFQDISNQNIKLIPITKELPAASSHFIKTIRYDILKSNKQFNLLIIGLYSDTEQNDLAGYLFFVNPVKNLSDLKELEILGKQVSYLLNSNTQHRENEKKERDRIFINGLVDSKGDFESLLSNISDYFIKEFHLIGVSFRVPVINGIETNVIPKDKLLFPLRRFDLSHDFKIVADSEAKIIENYFRITRKVLKLSELSYCNDVKESFAAGIINCQCSDNIDNLSKPIKDILRKSVKIIVPIHKSNKVDDTLYKENKWKDLYGVFNLRAYDIENWDNIKTRLEYLASHITHVINGNIDSKKHDQMRILKEEIDGLKFEPDIFYKQIALLVAKVLNAEICSIFMVDKNEEKLTLKATTTEYAVFNDAKINIHEYLEEYKNFDSFFYLLTETDRHTVSVISENKPRLDYKTDEIGLPKKFREQTSSGKGDNYSVLFVPLKDKDHSAVGVIKCLGKQESTDNLSNTFWNFDKETLELVAVLAERFIENAEFDKQKDIFIKQVAHETLSPLQQLLNQSENLSSTLKRDNYKLPKDFDKFFTSIADNIELFKNIIIDIEDVSIDETHELNLSTRNEDVKKIIFDIVKMFDAVAFRAGKKIIPNISDMPLLKVDKIKIKQAIINLLTNAINYSDNNTKIELFYKECNETFHNTKVKWWHELIIVNQGIGITKDFEQTNLFKLYKRGNNAIAKRPSGRGIGLFLVKKIMESHGGRCIVRNRNNPTKISILFPKH